MFIVLINFKFYVISGGPTKVCLLQTGSPTPCGSGFLIWVILLFSRYCAFSLIANNQNGAQLRKTLWNCGTAKSGAKNTANSRYL